MKSILLSYIILWSIYIVRPTIPEMPSEIFDKISTIIPIIHEKTEQKMMPREPWWQQSWFTKTTSLPTSYDQQTHPLTVTFTFMPKNLITLLSVISMYQLQSYFYRKRVLPDGKKIARSMLNHRHHLITLLEGLPPDQRSPEFKVCSKLCEQFFIEKSLYQHMPPFYKYIPSVLMYALLEELIAHMHHYISTKLIYNNNFDNYRNAIRACWYAQQPLSTHNPDPTKSTFIIDGSIMITAIWYKLFYLNLSNNYFQHTNGQLMTILQLTQGLPKHYLTPILTPWFYVIKKIIGHCLYVISINRIITQQLIRHIIHQRDVFIRYLHDRNEIALEQYILDLFNNDYKAWHREQQNIYLRYYGLIDMIMTASALPSIIAHRANILRYIFEQS